MFVRRDSTSRKGGTEPVSVVVVEGGAPLADDHGKSLFQGVMVGNGNQKKMKTMVAMRGNWCFSWHSGGGDTDKGKCVSFP